MAQPILFAVEYAVFKLWEQWGVRPAALIGHSLGEISGACAAGVIDLAAALELVSERGRLMQSASPGAMLAVPLGAGALRPRLREMIEIAAINAPESCVVGGPQPVVAEFAAHLRAEGIEPQALNVSHAFHSAAMEPILADFAAVMRHHKFAAAGDTLRIKSERRLDSAPAKRPIRSTTCVIAGAGSVCRWAGNACCAITPMPSWSRSGPARR